MGMEKDISELSTPRTCEICGEEYILLHVPFVKLKNRAGEEFEVNKVEYYGEQYNLCPKCFKPFIYGWFTAGLSTDLYIDQERKEINDKD